MRDLNPRIIRFAGVTIKPLWYSKKYSLKELNLRPVSYKDTALTTELNEHLCREDGIRTHTFLILNQMSLPIGLLLHKIEPSMGFEPTTIGVQNRYSTSWAKKAKDHYFIVRLRLWSNKSDFSLTGHFLP